MQFCRKCCTSADISELLISGFIFIVIGYARDNSTELDLRKLSFSPSLATALYHQDMHEGLDGVE